MTNGIDNLPSIDLAVLGGAARSVMFAMFLPILFPIYLWDCWSSEHEDRENRAPKATLTAEDVGRPVETKP